MTEKNAKKLTELLLTEARNMPPQEFAAFFCGGLIANVVGNMTENYWREFSKIEPCGRPGCDCHLGLMPISMKLLALLREDHQKHVDKTIAE